MTQPMSPGRLAPRGCHLLFQTGIRLLLDLGVSHTCHMLCVTYDYTSGPEVSVQRDAYFLPRINQVRIFNHFPVGLEDFWIIHGITEILLGNF